MSDIRPYPAGTQEPRREELRFLLGALMRAQQPLEAVVLQIEQLYAAPTPEPGVTVDPPADTPESVAAKAQSARAALDAANEASGRYLDVQPEGNVPDDLPLVQTGQPLRRVPPVRAP